ncbi:MAG: hypothetical protein WDZ45_11270 [Flavobacteriaceae bacterium]
MRLKLLLISIPLFFISCGGEGTPIPITFVFDQPLLEGKYPDYFKDITEPFSASECDKDILLKPINVTRLDIKKAPVEINAWYFEQMGDNTVEFSKNWLTQYFNDSLKAKHLTAPSLRKANQDEIDSYLKKENILTLIFAENSDSETYNENTVYHSSKDIIAKIRESLCEDIFSEVVIFVNPSKLVSNNPPLPPTGEGDPPPGPDDPCQQNTVADGLDLKEAISEIIDTGKKPSERDKIARETWKKYFDENAAITMYLKPNQSSPEGFWESGDGAIYFIDRLAYMSSIIDVNITRIEYHRETKKISGITVVECHNASEAL